MDQLFKMFSTYMEKPELIVVAGLSLFLVFLFLLILSTLLPFAVFGIKKKLFCIVEERQKSFALIGRLLGQHQKISRQLSELSNAGKSKTDWLPERKVEKTSIDEPGTEEDLVDGTQNDIDDKRKHPRLEFHCSGMAFGHKVFVRDISEGGLFIDMDELPEKLDVGRVINIDLNLPTENEKVRLKAKIISKNEKGLGCKYFEISQSNLMAVKNCFEEFKNTLPVRKSNESDETSSNQSILEENGAPYSGNTSVKVFHKKECRYYDCKNCTAKFSTREQALDAGYSPCGICNP